MQNDIESCTTIDDFCICEKSISVCEIKGKHNFICVNCNKYCVISDEDSTTMKSNSSSDTVLSRLSKISVNSNPSIQILTIGSPTENKLISLNDKYNIKIIAILLLFLLCITAATILYFVNE